MSINTEYRRLIKARVTYFHFILACNCNSEGAVDASCDDGICTCKDGWAGMKCGVCKCKCININTIISMCT